MPWALAKDSSKTERLKTVLYNLTESIIIGTSLLAPFMPDTANKTAAMFNLSLRDFDEVNKFGIINTVKVTETPEILFARIDGAKVMEKVNAMIEERKAAIEGTKEPKKEEKKAEVKKSEEVLLLEEIRDLLKNKENNKKTK